MKKLYSFFSLDNDDAPCHRPQGSVIVIAPNGGENWIIGCPCYYPMGQYYDCSGKN